MGLLTGLLTLPLAPVRGVVWVAEQLQEEAERQLDPGERLRVRLESLRVSYELGELTEAEYEQAEDEALAELEPAPPQADRDQEED